MQRRGKSSGGWRMRRRVQLYSTTIRSGLQANSPFTIRTWYGIIRVQSVMMLAGVVTWQVNIITLKIPRRRCCHTESRDFFIWINSLEGNKAGSKDNRPSHQRVLSRVIAGFIRFCLHKKQTAPPWDESPWGIASFGVARYSTTGRVKSNSRFIAEWRWGFGSVRINTYPDFFRVGELCLQFPPFG